MKKPGILFVMNTLRPGGAEMFVLRLAKYLSSSFDIHIYSCLSHQDSPEFIGQFENTVRVQWLNDIPAELPKWKEWLFWKSNALASVIGIQGFYSKLKQNERKRYFQRELKNRNIKIINSSETHSDAFAINYLKHHFGIPVVVTLHSAYNKENWGVGDFQKRFFENALNVLGGADSILYTAEANLEIFKQLRNYSGPQPEKVYLGYVPIKTHSIRADLGIPKDAFVVSMMARGIPEKGWQQAIEAFFELLKQVPNSYLLLIHTDTPFLSDLKNKYATTEQIQFLGYLENPANVLASSDCSILPSHFPESLPYAITESLACGTPVFATPIAEIPEMLKTNIGFAGNLIPFNSDNVADSKKLAELLVELASSTSLRKELRQRAEKAFQKFSMEACGSRYKRQFDILVDGK